MDNITIKSPFSPTLIFLSISNGILSPRFSPHCYFYSAADVEYDVTHVIITPIAKDPCAVIDVDGFNIWSGQTAKCNLVEGLNIINVQVTSGDTKQTYVIHIERKPESDQ